MKRDAISLEIIEVLETGYDLEPYKLGHNLTSSPFTRTRKNPEISLGVFLFDGAILRSA